VISAIGQSPASARAKAVPWRRGNRPVLRDVCGGGWARLTVEKSPSSLPPPEWRCKPPPDRHFRLDITTCRAASGAAVGRRLASLRPPGFPGTRADSSLFSDSMPADGSPRTPPVPTPGHAAFTKTSRGPYRDCVPGAGRRKRVLVRAGGHRLSSGVPRRESRRTFATPGQPRGQRCRTTTSPRAPPPPTDPPRAGRLGPYQCSFACLPTSLPAGVPSDGGLPFARHRGGTAAACETALQHTAAPPPGVIAQARPKVRSDSSRQRASPP
jgi:hypothetical protein